LAGTSLDSALLVLAGGVPELVVVDPHTGEVGLFAGRPRTGLRELP
jgi:hypothetical protein